MCEQKKCQEVSIGAANSPGMVLCTDRLRRSREAAHHVEIFPRSCCVSVVYHSCIRSEEKAVVKGFGLRMMKGYVRLLVFGVGEDALGLESSPGLLKSPCLDAGKSQSAPLLCLEQSRLGRTNLVSGLYA